MSHTSTTVELGVVHQVTDVKVEKGLRYVKVRCGTTLIPDMATDRQTEWSAWQDDVTCGDCLVRSA